MGVDFIFRIRLRVQPPPGASLFFKCILLRLSERCAGDGKYHRKWVRRWYLGIEYGKNSLLRVKVTLPDAEN